MTFLIHLVYLAVVYAGVSRELRAEAELSASPLAPALQAHPADFAQCFAKNEPAVAGAVTIECRVSKGGLCTGAGIVPGPRGIDDPAWDLVHERGLCLIDQFNLGSGVQVAAATPEHARFACL